MEAELYSADYLPFKPAHFGSGELFFHRCAQIIPLAISSYKKLQVHININWKIIYNFL
jgi:hypothetical protein